jgi:nicotinic acid mononucleotide adenylyltransferase
LTDSAASIACAVPSSEPFRVATYFGAFDPVHENHIRQALAACGQFRIDACFLCPNADEGNSVKSIGVPLLDRLEMLQRRCHGQNLLRAYNCSGRGWNWEGRSVATTSTALRLYFFTLLQGCS